MDLQPLKQLLYQMSFKKAFGHIITNRPHQRSLNIEQDDILYRRVIRLFYYLFYFVIYLHLSVTYNDQVLAFLVFTSSEEGERLRRRGGMILSCSSWSDRSPG